MLPAARSSTSSTPATVAEPIVAIRQGRTSSTCGARKSTARDSRRAGLLLLPRLDPVPGAAQTLVERDLRPPGELPLGQADVQHAALDVTVAGRLQPRR